MKVQNINRNHWLSLTLAITMSIAIFCYCYSRFATEVALDRHPTANSMGQASPKAGDAHSAITSPSLPATQRQANQALAAEAFGKLPISFIENRGQLDSEVAYYLQGHDKTVYFTAQGITFALTGGEQWQTAVDTIIRPATFQPASFVLATEREPVLQRWAMKLDFVGANPGARPVGQDQTEAVISYFKGARDHWRSGLKTYSTVAYADLWPGIDLVYSGTVNRLKYRFVVKPGADPKQIWLSYRGASRVSVNDAGQLEVRTPVGGFHDDRPVAYQDSAAGKREVSAAYELANDVAARAAAYGFSLGAYDRSKPLVLDPAVVVYCGLIGGTGDESGNSIAVDEDRNVYVAGTTSSADDVFPATAGRAVSFKRGFSDVFVTKVNAEGTSLVYASFFGGKGENLSHGIAVDKKGNAYVTGQTSAADFPVVNARQKVFGGGSDAFVAKLNPSGASLSYSTYLGGPGADEIHGIAVDAKGSVYVTGSTEGNLPATDGAFKNYYSGGAHDAFVAKLNPAAPGGDFPGYITYLGGGGDDRGFGVAVDGEGAAYVTGQTSSFDFPAVGAAQPSLNGAVNAFVTKLNPSGSALAYSTFLGGSGTDIGQAVAVNENGEAFITGSTTSQDFPTITSWRATLFGASDCFVTKLNESGQAFVYSTYLGGSGNDEGYGIALNSSGNAFIIGRTNSLDFPLTNPWQSAYGGGYWDAFVTQLSPVGSSPVYSSYFGGSGDDRGNAIAVSSAGIAYLTGATTSADFPTVQSFQTSFSGGADAFVARIENTSVAEATSLTCSGTKDWIAGNGTWQTAANWSGGTLPTSTDDVCIPAGVTVTLSSGTHTINSLGSNSTLVFSAGSLTVTNSFNSDGAVTINGGALTLNNTSIINNAFTLSSGTLAGMGGVTVTGVTTWSGGTMSGIGVTNANGGLSLNGTDKTLSNRTLNNDGIATWTAGNLNFNTFAVLNNLAGATFDAQSNLFMFGGGNGTFNNAGLFKKSSGTGITSVGVTCNNSGSVQLLIGSLSVVGGTHTGPFTGSAGTTLDFTLSGTANTSTFNTGADITAPTVTFTGGTANIGSAYNVTGSTTLNSTGSGATPTVNFNGTLTNLGNTFTANAGTATVNANPATAPSTLNVAGGTVNFNFNSAITINTVNLNPGTLNGPTTMNISGLLNWTGGTMSGAGTTNANGGINLSGTGRTLSGRILNNAGTATWTAGDLNFSNPAVFNNLAGATFDIQNTNGNMFGGGNGTFNNAGLLKKSSGSGTTGVWVTCNNSGSVQLLTGTLSLVGGTHTGPFTGSAGTTFDFTLSGTANTSTFNAGANITAPTVTFTGGTANIGSIYNVTNSTMLNATTSGVTPTVNLNGTLTNLGSTFTANAGTANVNSNPATAPATLNVTGGTVNFNFNSAISINTVNLSPGTLNGPTTMNISGLLNWTGGTMTGAGTTNANGGINLSGVGRTLNGRTLNNTTTATWTAGDINFSNPAVFNNTAGATFDIQNTNGNMFGGGNGTFNNAGLLKKSSGTGTTGVWVTCNNSGSVQLLTGTLSFVGGTHTGPFTGSAGTTFDFTASGAANTVIFNAGADITAPTVTFTGGLTANIGSTYNVAGSTTVNASSSGAIPTVNFNGTLTNLGSTFTANAGTANVNSNPATAPATLNVTGGTVNFNFNSAISINAVNLSGTLNGPTTMNISGLLNWTGGTMTGAGTTNANGSMSLTGGKTLSGRTLNTAGIATWTTGDINYSGAAVINNLAGGIFDAQSNQLINGGATGTFNNAGLFRKSAGTGTTGVWGIAFKNTGTVSVQVGTLQFTGSVTQTAGATSLAGGTITSTNTFNLQGGSLTGTGTITANVSNTGGGVSPSKDTVPTSSTGILNLTGNYTQTAAGALNVDLGGTSAGSGFDQFNVSGTATLAGTLNVTTLAGYTPNANDAFKVLTYNTRSGNFAAINYLNKPTYRDYQANYNAKDLTLLTQVISVADLALTMLDSPDPAPVGGNLTYTLNLSNSGPDAATNVSVSDALPAGLNFISAAATQGTCTGTSTITCNLGTLNNGGTATVTIIVQPTLSLAGTSVSNTANVTATEVDSNTANNSATATTAIIHSADLVLTMTDAPDPVFAGDDLTYTLVVSNNGPSSATSVTLTDTLPAGTFVSASAGCSQAFGTVTCNLGTLASAANATVTIVLRPTGSGTINNTASVSSGVYDPNAANNTAAQSTTINPKADLSITKSDSPDPVLVGSNLTYTIRVTNNGPSPATGVVVTDTLPASVNFVSAAATQGACSGTSTINCNLGTLAINQVVFVTIVVTPTAAAVPAISNTASVTSDIFDFNTANNSATQTTTVNAVTDLVIALTDAPDPVLVEDNLTYTASVTNNGPADATGVTLTDHLPGSVTFVSAASTSGSCAQAGSTVTCNIGALANTASATVTIVVVPTATAAGTLNNTASVSGVETDPATGNNAATASTVVNPKTDLSITKTDLPDPVYVGSPLTYEIKATNNGPSAATGVVVTDTLPAAVTFDVASFNTGSAGQSCNYNGETRTVTCNIGNLANGVTANVTIVVIPEAAAVPSITNTASVTGNQTDPNAANNAATAVTTVLPRADLSITKSDSPDPVPVGNQLTYTIVATNNGPSPATDVTVNDPLSPTVTFVSAASTAGSCSPAGATVTCNIGNLAIGASATVTIIVTPNVVGTVSNTASVSAVENDPITSNNAATQGTTVIPKTDLSITKSASPNPVTVFNSLSYTIVATNNGPSLATGVTVTDPLPAGVSFVSASAGCSQAGGVVTCAAGSLSNGAAASFTIVVTPTIGGTISNTASVAGNEFDPNSANNTATASATVNAAADLAITNAATPDPVLTGTQLSYTLTVTNNGPGIASSVVVSDNLPGALTFVSCVATGGGVCGGSANNRSVSFTSLAAAASATITIVAQVNCSVVNGAALNNTATVNAATPDLLTDNNSAAVIVMASDPPPTITAPPAVNVTTGAGATACATVVSDAQLGTASANDNCGTTTITRSGVPVGNLFPVGTTTVTYTATDGNGDMATATQLVTVIDTTPPVIACPANLDVVGNLAGACGATVNPGTPAATDNCAGVSVAGMRSDGQPLNAAYPLGTTTITWTATDEAGNQASCSQTVTVTNPAPVVTITGPATGSVYSVGTPVNFTGSFTDNPGGTHTATWTFDNLTSAGTVNEATGTVTGSRTFAAAGVYKVSLTVTDGCGGTGSANTVGGLDLLVVVYDPSGGWVTGGGWINSPAGAYVPNPSLTGKANFGFVSKYQNGATIPTGNTEFQFKAGNMNFSSTSYEWLVVAGKKAQYKGLGTINGSGSYRFMLTAIDGDLPGGGGQDKFRIKLWSDGGGLVYDNQLNAPDSDDPTTVLGGGQIVIHSSSGNAPTRATQVTNDFDGDGKTDLAVWHGMTGDWLVSRSSDNGLSKTAWGAQADPYRDVLAAGDYDGDGKIDLAVFRRSDSIFYVKGSANGAIIVQPLGDVGDVPVPGDYDGDGKTDFAVWRASAGSWIIKRSSDGKVQTIQWGAGSAPYNDVPVQGDYDGDGKCDVAVFRLGDGHWYIKRSSDDGVINRAWGLATDVPVPGDYDGDGKCDIAVWRGSEGNWYIIRSTDDSTKVVLWGLAAAGDVPVPGDYDGDGKCDAAVWREPEGRWYVLTSAAGSTRAQQHGQPGDTPVAARWR